MAAAYCDVVSLPSASSVNGAGQTTWKLTGTVVPPRSSVQLRLAVACVLPTAQVPVSGPPLMAPVPVAVTVCAKPWKGSEGAAQVVVVVALVPVPKPAALMATFTPNCAVVPTMVPPTAVTVEPAVGV